MSDYLIYRHGSNAFNQSMTPVAAVAIVNGANSAEQAKNVAAENGIECYNNQHLSAVAFDDLEDCDEWNSLIEQDAILRDTTGATVIFDAE